jgi:hypothetical protein
VSQKKEKDSEIETDDSQSRPNAFTADVAKRKILLILREGDTFFSQHLLDDIATGRHGVSHQDVLHVLKTGEILSEPVWDEIQRNWKYKIEGTDLEEEELRAITIIIEERFSLFIVTAY